MDANNKKFLDDNLHHFVVYERAFYLRGLSGQIRSEMQRIMGAEFQPGYIADLWCDACVVEMVTRLYRCYYNYLKELHHDETKYKDLSEGITILSQKPLIVHAAFPSNKK